MASSFDIFSKSYISQIPASAPSFSAPTAAPKTSFFNVLKNVVQNSSVQTKAVTQEAAKTAPSLKKDIKIPVPNLIQGNNECGPTSLAMLMKYYGINPGNYHNMFESDTVGHSPLALRAKALDKHMTVRQENNGSLEDLAALVDKGVPPMVLGIYGGGNNSTVENYINNASKAHWMVVTGYKKDDAGKITHIYFNDPNRSSTQCWTAGDFQNKFWNNNIIPGGHRYYMAAAPRGSYQEAALKQFLPSDKLSDSFKTALNVIYELERAFYSAEKAAKAVANAGEDAATAIANAGEDAWNEVSSWFS